ncbi:MAG: DUF559 domain-containing protein [Verrucomicrobia bacterium]|nr:DUF559 domain-containing protein [Verrucomicrobiota bacterium]
MQLVSVANHNLRAVLLDQAGEHRWLDRQRGRPCFRGIPDNRTEAGAWLQRTLASPEARALCAGWVASELDMTPASARDASRPLRSVFAARLFATAGHDSRPARLCAAVLNWTPAHGLHNLNAWLAWAAVGPPPELLPAFVLDAAGGSEAAVLSAGDQLASAGFPVALQVTPTVWQRFITEQPSWDRCATRWRAAEAFGSDTDAGQAAGGHAAKTEQFLRAHVPEAVALLDHARTVVPARSNDDAAASQARSAAEALLFAVLDARPATRKKFRLNAPLDFSFGPRPAEGDLTATQARLVVEIDGYHHFRDQAGYRRDRRKDELLQAHGWFVIRFLAEDIVSDLETVLHRIEERLARLEAARMPDQKQ